MHNVFLTFGLYRFSSCVDVVHRLMTMSNCVVCKLCCDENCCIFRWQRTTYACISSVLLCDMCVCKWACVCVRVSTVFVSVTLCRCCWCLLQVVRVTHKIGSEVTNESNIPAYRTKYDTFHPRRHFFYRLRHANSNVLYICYMVADFGSLKYAF